MIGPGPLPARAAALAVALDAALEALTEDDVALDDMGTCGEVQENLIVLHVLLTALHDRDHDAWSDLVGSTA